MRRVDALLADYASHHRTRGNLVCHGFGITLIVFGLLSMLQAAPLFRGSFWTAAEAVIAAVFFYYLTLDAPLAFAMLAVLVLLDAASRAVSNWRTGLAAFLIGWVFQAIGHGRFERNRPAFLKNLAHLAIGPMFLVNELLKVRDIDSSVR
jgi:uncharacterized membrane protein YGL010W